MANSLSDKSREEALKVYDLYLQDLGRIGALHSSVRQYYVTIITALIAFLALAGKDGLLNPNSLTVDLVVGVIGVLLSALWFADMVAFSKIYAAKLDVVVDMERVAQFPLSPFTAENQKMETDRRPSTTAVDMAAAALVGLLFAAVFVFGLKAGPG